MASYGAILIIIIIAIIAYHDDDDDYHGDEANVLNDIHVLVYVCVLKKKRIVDGHQTKRKNPRQQPRNDDNDYDESFFFTHFNDIHDIDDDDNHHYIYHDYY